MYYGELISNNLNMLISPLFYGGVIGIFRTFRRKVDYAFYCNKAQIMILKLSKFSTLSLVMFGSQKYKAESHPMEYICYLSECSLNCN